MSLPTLRAQLNKKAEFLGAVDGILLLIEKNVFGSPTELFDVVKRTHVVLSTRYNSLVFWKSGLSLFRASQSVLTEQTQQSSILQFISSAEQAIRDLEQEAPAPAVTQTPNPSSTNPPALDANLSLLFGDVAALLANTDFLGDSGPPPASRDAVYDLRLRKVDESDGSSCAVCLEPLHQGKGSKAKQMPCKHLFHEECLEIWLEKKNSCPTCRHQLPSQKQHFDLDADKVARRDPREIGLYA
eukprot:c9886_g1_i1.p2 GENE.c9886_g1_i1~~c9886_g1_i1.p2  ORF type:complete len:242 (+),score=58.68 c9886_g1_i1:45-770(+)